MMQEACQGRRETDMRISILTTIALATVQSFLILMTAVAQEAPTDMNSGQRRGFSSDPRDPDNILSDIEQGTVQPGALIPVSPLGRLRDHTDAAKQRRS